MFLKTESWACINNSRNIYLIYNIRNKSYLRSEQFAIIIFYEWERKKSNQRQLLNVAETANNSCYVYYKRTKRQHVDIENWFLSSATAHLVICIFFFILFLLFIPSFSFITFSFLQKRFIRTKWMKKNRNKWNNKISSVVVRWSLLWISMSRTLAFSLYIILLYLHHIQRTSYVSK